ncbi:unnamed protein product [Urochloa humidicola]
MDPSSLDRSHGEIFAAKVRQLFDAPVVSDPPDEVGSFWFLAAFSHSHLRLSVESVGQILEPILGGKANLFDVVHVEDFIFKFSVSGKAVGFSISTLAINSRFSSTSGTQRVYQLPHYLLQAIKAPSLDGRKSNKKNKKVLR